MMEEWVQVCFSPSLESFLNPFPSFTPSLFPYSSLKHTYRENVNGKTPREFKFVGAFSRKRRRRDGTAPGSIDFVGPTTRSKQAATKPQSEAVAAEPATPPKSADGNSEGRDKSADNTTPPAVEATETGAEARAPLAATPVIPHENANPFDHDMMMGEGMNSGSDIDWTYSSLMNPFIDTGPSFMAPFDQVNGQLPIYFGPDIPLIQLGDS